MEADRSRDALWYKAKLLIEAGYTPEAQADFDHLSAVVSEFNKAVAGLIAARKDDDRLRVEISSARALLNKYNFKWEETNKTIIVGWENIRHIRECRKQNTSNMK